MQITFDPLVQSEVDKVLEIIGIPKPVRSFADVVASQTAQEDTAEVTSQEHVVIPPAPMPDTPVATAVPSAPNLVDLDKNGIPWDERIHSSSRAKIADGSWKLKRGVDDNVVSTVKAELEGFKPLPPTKGEDIIIVPIPAPAAPDGKAAFVALVTKASRAISEKKITPEQMAAICATVGIPNVMALSAKLDLVPAVSLQIDALLS